jgi:hypothetical protein
MQAQTIIASVKQKRSGVILAAVLNLNYYKMSGREQVKFLLYFLLTFTNCIQDLVF